MQKLLKISSILSLWFAVSLGVWTAILVAYFYIADTETLTMFEKIMAFLVSINIAEKLIDIVFEAQEETQKAGADNG